MEIKSIEIIKQEFNNGNNGIIYDEINFEDKNKYNWKCNDCSEIWQTSNYQRRIVKKGNCLFCTGQKVRKVENSKQHSAAISDAMDRTQGSSVHF